MSNTPPPGTSEAKSLGCRCFRIKGTYDQWDWSFCDLHAPVMPTGPNLCEHGETKWACEECDELRAMNQAFAEDMRGLRYRRENDFGGSLG